MNTPSDPSDLTGTVAVVTGAARGIGRSIALSLANTGATCACVDLADSNETCEQILDSGGHATQYTADLIEEPQVDALFDRIEHDHGEVGVLVNNAGYYSVERRPFWEIDLDEWEKVMNVNVRSVFMCAKRATVSMRLRKKGRIVNISSDAVTFGMPFLMHYVAAKSAIVGMTRSMARELGPFGITVNAVAPGLVKTTTAITSIGSDVLEQVASEQPIEQSIEPIDIASAVTYLCSDHARLISGQTLLINGGTNMGGI